MDRLFFHNKYDNNSIEELNNLNTDVLIYDVFDQNVGIPFNIKLSYLPYLIDNYIYFEINTYTIGAINLQFICKDYQDNININENKLFLVYINNEKYEIIPENGVLEIELTCTSATTINIKIEGDTYLPFETDIEVIESA